MITSFDGEDAVNLRYSQPIQVQISPFVRCSIPFNMIVPTKDIALHGSKIIESKNFKVGQKLEAKYVGNG